MNRSGDPGLVAAESVRAAADRLAGDTLVSVGYLGEPPRDPTDAAVEEVSQGVRLLTRSGWVALVRWFTPGYGTGVEVITGPEAAAAIEQTELVDVGDRRRWAPLLGRPIVRIGAAWADQGLIELPRAPWSLRLELDVGPVVIAIGRIESGRPVWDATSILVFFDGADARRYVPSGDLGPAWGTTLLSELAVDVLIASLDGEVGDRRLDGLARRRLADRDPAGCRAALTAAVDALRADGLIEAGGPGAQVRVTPAGRSAGARFLDERDPRPIT